MKTPLDNQTAKNAPPSDKRLNNIAFVLGIMTCSLLSCYFFTFALTIAIKEYRPFFVFAYIVFPLVAAGILSGAFICITQLLRNVYYKVLISSILYATSFLAVIIFMIIVAVFQNEILLPFVYN